MACCCFFFFQAEDGIRDLVRSRGLGDVYKRQGKTRMDCQPLGRMAGLAVRENGLAFAHKRVHPFLSLIHI